MFIVACECGTRVYSTRTGPGHGCVFSVLCFAAAYFPPGGVYDQNLYWSLCATFSACIRAVRSSVWTARAVYLVCVFVDVRRSAYAARALYHSS